MMAAPAITVAWPMGAMWRWVIALRGAAPGFGQTLGFGENKVVMGR
jgi:hypothetical protein